MTLLPKVTVAIQPTPVIKAAPQIKQPQSVQNMTQPVVPIQSIDPNALAQTNSPNSTILTTYIGVSIMLTLVTALVLGILNHFKSPSKEAPNDSGCEVEIKLKWGKSKTSEDA